MAGKTLGVRVDPALKDKAKDAAVWKQRQPGHGAYTFRQLIEDAITAELVKLTTEAGGDIPKRANDALRPGRRISDG